MATAREIKRRIRSVKNVRQITKALESVAAGRVRRAQQMVEATRPYSQRARDLLASVASLAGGETRHPLLTQREQVNSAAVILISGDRGLAGAFNSNVSRVAFNFARDYGKPVHFITIGKKGRDFIYRRGGKIAADFSGMPARPTLLDTTPATRAAIDDFLSGTADEVYLIYTEFISATQQKPVIKRLLPLTREAIMPDQARRGPRPAYEFEPGPSEILNTLLPRLTEMQVYQAVLESLASFYTAQRIAMRNATDNASDLIVAYTLSYNKARQAGITNELLDIAGGAEALRQAMEEAAKALGMPAGSAL
ncbi:MAG: ATP synthase F1 subunit gamma [Candidatus Thermofonsia Clade 3 bacterium]|jgi:F-type H+-transporting ATPase subunit gamma|uniref:ATP synthase gamma chain n=1 Tax=Candidatus Thermofonsia Clade 3 bacterium TaxID=2364212 RepID=A0A2M8QB15_9CHLR|nr:ATP synthase F1 subunit gamma [Candidatus Roseilinea sp. NK_OTU-006]PJF46996.1 MAG: ATP synthase F1 subunit gamma [Candidatus Thermofonsia Clade 3 bacterium]